MKLLLSEAGIISTCLQGLLQGVATFMFVLMVFILSRESRHRPLNRGMFAASTALILLSTAEFITNIVRLVRGIITIGPTFPGGVEAFFASISEPTFLVKGILHPIQILVLDGVVILRAYVAWQNYFVLVVPGIGWCSILASTIGLCYALLTAYQNPQSVFALRTATWITAVYATTLATNITATFLLAHRLWRVNRRVEGFGSSPKLRVVYQVVIESGAIYTTFSITTLLLFLVHDPVVYIIRDLIPPVISIVFNMIVVRVAFATTRKLSVLGVEGSRVVTKSAINFGGDTISQGTSSSSARGPAIFSGTSSTRSDTKQGKSLTVELTQFNESDNNLSSKDDKGSMVKAPGGSDPSGDAGDVHSA